MNNRLTIIIGNILFAILVYFVIFQDLGYKPLMVWDESRNAVNALEMLWNGNFLIRHYEGSPDMWEVKPPFLIWLQAISMKFLGFNEKAIRLPSALSVVGIIIAMIYFFKKEFNQPLIGYFSGLVLITSVGFMGEHIARSGDHDALLTFLLFAASICFYWYLRYEKPKQLYLTTIFLILAVYTKSIVGFFVLPGFLVFTVLQKKLLPLIRRKELYVSIVLFLMVVGAYYGLREFYNPVYLSNVWELELFGRLTGSSENFRFERDPWWFYIFNLLDGRFNYWISIFLISLALFTFSDMLKEYKSIYQYCLVMFLSVLFILSNASTKDWYDAPLYPYLSVMVGLTLFAFYSLMASKGRFGLSKTAILCCFVILVFSYPYGISADNSYKPQPPYGEVTFGVLFRQLEVSYPEFRHFTIVHNDYNSHIEFYQLVFNRYKGYDIDRIKPAEGLHPGDTIMIGQTAIYEQVHREFKVQQIDAYQNAQLLILHQLDSIH